MLKRICDVWFSGCPSPPPIVVLLIAAISWSAIMGTAFADERVDKPNIIVIISDDQGWKDIGYNDSDVRTPHLDRLAATGVRLTRNYVFPTCSPTRVALLAGRNPSRYGILGPIGGRSEQALPPETVTIADFLAEHGYFTAISGKWHLGLRPEVGPLQYGFASTYGYLHGQLDQYAHVYKNGDRTWHRQDEFIDEEGHATDLLTDEAIRIIEAKRDQPFFLYLAYSVPHYPLQEPDEWVEPYLDTIKDRDRRLFAASLTHMDDGIGRIVSALEQTNQRANTLIVYTSDNGGQKDYHSKTDYDGGKFSPNKVLGNNLPYRAWKGALYEGGIRVPALVNWPGTLQPRVVDATVSVLDWYPTLAAVIGADIPADRKLEGVNVWPLLRGDTSHQLPERSLYWKTRQQSAVLSGDWKLMEFTGRASNRQELYNLADDPYERTNVLGKRPQVAERLRRQLERERAQDR